MSVNLTLVLATALLVGAGVYLMLERSLTRVLVGLVMVSNGVNISFLVASGPAGNPPLVDEYDPSTISDPVPQAFALTAIVITLATVAFVLAMAYRSWRLTGHDDVQDDAEDAAIRRLAEADEASDTFDLSSGRTTDDADEVYEEEGAPETVASEGVAPDEVPLVLAASGPTVATTTTSGSTPASSPTETEEEQR